MHRARACVDVEHAVHRAQRQGDHARVGVHVFRVDPADDAGAATKRNDGVAARLRPLQHAFELGLAARHSDRVGHIVEPPGAEAGEVTERAAARVQQAPALAHADAIGEHRRRRDAGVRQRDRLRCRRRASVQVLAAEPGAGNFQHRLTLGFGQRIFKVSPADRIQRLRSCVVHMMRNSRSTPPSSQQRSCSTPLVSIEISSCRPFLASDSPAPER